MVWIDRLPNGHYAIAEEVFHHRRTLLPQRFHSASSARRAALAMNMTVRPGRCPYRDIATTDVVMVGQHSTEATT